MISKVYTNEVCSVEASNSHALDMQIARQCAPLLAGIKISNFLITQKANREKVEKIFSTSQVEVRCIYQDEERVTQFLYKKEEMLLKLQEPEVKAFLYRIGYQELQLSGILECITYRYQAYMKMAGPFPHEIGVLLGYPVADVAGFMQHEGKNFLYLGYWKVYSDLQGALNTFYSYRMAKEVIVHLVRCGYSINSILTEYQLQDRYRTESQSVAV